MSGAKLCTLLSDLGFEGAESLDVDSFEWPFQYEDARPVLDWICSSLRPSNVLSCLEVSQREQLLHSGHLLEGEDLDFAYDSISAFSTRREIPDTVFGTEDGLRDVRDATLSYREEALQLHKEVSCLQCQLGILIEHAAALNQGKRARVTATSGLSGQLTTLDGGVSPKNLEINAVLSRIASTSEELARYHSGDEDGIYLAYSDFSDYLKKDSSWLKELNQRFTELLDSDAFKFVSDEGKAKCPWTSLDYTPATLLHDLEISHNEDVIELQRLRSIYGISERQWVEAEVENAKQHAILLTLKSQVTSDESHIRLDLRFLRRKHTELVSELTILHGKENKLLSETVPDLCWELAQLQDTYILQGDYDIKVLRQDCYINRQKTFINHLCNILAGHMFMKVACQYEKESIVGAYSLLKAIELEIQEYLSTARGRMDTYLAQAEVASNVHEQGAVHDHDNFLHGIRDILSIHLNIQGGFSRYVSTLGIVQQISNLRSEMLSLQSELENSLPMERNRCINTLCALIQGLQQLLFSSSTTAQPLLTPRHLMEELDQMEKANAQLSAAVEEVTLEHFKKNEIIKHHSQEVGLQRRIFIDFFCNPEQLKSHVRELTARARALKESV